MTETPKSQPPPEPVTAFHRRELQPILDVYGRLVLAGEARDYAIGMERDVAVFAIFRHHAERPTWQIEKQPELAQAQGQYVVYGAMGQVLRRGRDLETVLKVFEGRRFRIVR
jgi:Protein of unknown function (DUF2794)